MIRQWMFFYWANQVAIVTNTIFFSYYFMPINSWFIMPCIIVGALCMAPVFFAFTLWSPIKNQGICHLFLRRLFFKKISMSLSVTLVGFAWAWWGGGMAILGGSVVASILGNIVFWMVKRHELSAVLPDIAATRKTHAARMECAPTAVSISGIAHSYCGDVMLSISETGFSPLPNPDQFMASTVSTVDVRHHDSFNPASGLPMVISVFDSQGNVYGTNSANGEY